MAESYNQYTQPAPTPRSVEEILEDERERKAREEQQGGPGLGEQLMDDMESKAKQGIRKAVNSVVDKATDVVGSTVKKAAEKTVEATTGVDVSNNGKGIAGKIISGIAGAAGAKIIGTVASNFSDNKSDKSTYLPASQNLANQEAILNSNNQSGRKSKMLTFTDEQIESMSDADKQRLLGHECFIKNPDGETYKQVQLESMQSIYGMLEITSLPANTKHKELGAIAQSIEQNGLSFVADETLSDLFTTVTAEELDKQDKEPEYIDDILAAPKAPDNTQPKQPDADTIEFMEHFLNLGSESPENQLSL